jgi:hypothetical protein
MMKILICFVYSRHNFLNVVKRPHYENLICLPGIKKKAVSFIALITHNMERKYGFPKMTIVEF